MLAAGLTTLAVAAPAASGVGGAPAPQMLADCQHPSYRPKEILISCADATVLYEHLHWRSWGVRSAQGRGVLYVNNCLPDCADGSVHRRRVRVKLSRPLVCPNGALMFGRIAWRVKKPFPGTFPGKRRHGAGPVPVPCAPAGLPAPSLDVPSVALGDSYASGEGLSPYLLGSNLPGDRCHRSLRAYSQQLALPGHALHWIFVACSGATVANVLQTTQYLLEGSPQIYRLTDAMWARQGLITITIGGDDLGFGDVIIDCILHKNCERRRLERQKLREATQIAGPLAFVFGTVRGVAPQATIVALSYPHLFPPDRFLRRRCATVAVQKFGFRKTFFDRGERRFLNHGVDVIAAQTRAAAVRIGVHYVDPRRAFLGHEICGARGPWINGFHPGSFGKASFHPKAAGQKAEANLIEGGLANAIRSGAPLTRWGLPRNPPPQ